MSDVDLTTDLCGIRLANPMILASGILGTTKASLKRVAENGAGAVTIKSITREPRKGHANPTVIAFDAGLMNAVGYSNPGADEAVKEFARLDDMGIPVIASATGSTAADFVAVVERLVPLGFAAVEIPLSCPHTPGFGTLAGQSTPKATYEITSAVRKATKLPLFVKLSPNAPDLCAVAKAAEEAGANAITAVNTLGPGMIINIDARAPVLNFKVGGVSGPALRPIAVRCVYDLYKAVKIPIIGVGGISTGEHVIQMMMAGATAVGIGSGVYYRGVEVFRLVADEMAGWMAANGYSSPKNLIGAAHKC